MGAVQDKLLEEGTRPLVVDDCVALVDAEDPQAAAAALVACVDEAAGRLGQERS